MAGRNDTMAEQATRRVTRDDVARAANVSPATASFALNNHPRVSEKTRLRIQKVAASIGYAPNRAGQRLARARGDSRNARLNEVGLLYLPGSSAVTDAVCLGMMHGAEMELAQINASLTFVMVFEEGDWNKVNRLIQSAGVDGWLVYGRVTDAIIDRLRPAGLPFVILGDNRCTQPVHCANIDNRAISSAVVEHLASLGHRRIAYVDSAVTMVYQQRIVDGFRTAVREYGLDQDDRLIVHTLGRLIPGTGPSTLVDWLNAQTPRPTAIFCPQFDWAADACRILSEQQIRVPDDISVIAFGTTSDSAIRRAMTRVELPLPDVGRHGAQMLQRLVTDPALAPAEVCVIPHFATGWSTAARA